MFSEEELKKIINFESIGNFFPYKDGEYEDVENYIKRIVAELNRIPNIIAKADYSMYGSGYASYVDIFCCKKDNSSTKVENNIKWIKGILLYICRLAPVAVLGETEITQHENGGSSEFLDEEKTNKFNRTDWEDIVRKIEKVISNFGLTLLSKE